MASDCHMVQHSHGLDTQMREKMWSCHGGGGSRNGVLWSIQEANLELTGRELILVTWRSSCPSIWVGVWAQCLLPHQAAAWAGPCFPWRLLGVHSMQGSQSTDLGMELKGDSVRSSPAIWSLLCASLLSAGGPSPL